MRHRINEQIRAATVRLLGDGNASEVVSLKEAKKAAEDLGLDLVEISPNENPPVVKIMNYGKFRFSESKKKALAKKKQKQVKSYTAKSAKLHQ